MNREWIERIAKSDLQIAAGKVVLCMSMYVCVSVRLSR